MNQPSGHGRGRGRALPALAAALAALCGCASELGGDCRNNGDCAAGLLCISGTCQSAPETRPCGAGVLSCTADADCPARACRDGCCATACASVLDCSPGEVCRAGTCQPASAGGCTSSADCAATPATPRCKADTRACVECLVEADCGRPAIKVCGAGNRCAFAAGRCDAAADCAGTPATPACDTAAHRCVRCVQNSDCGSGQRCTAEHECVAGPCTTDAACQATPSTPRCEPGSGQCVECTADGHCSADGTRLCNASTHRCENAPPGCGSDAMCAATPATPRCRTADRTCVACLQNSHCQTGRCLSDNTCGAAGACAANADCGAPRPWCGGAKSCVECLDDGHCAGGDCLRGACVPATNGCLADGDCPAALSHCRTTDRTCVACLLESHCGPLKTCSAGACVAGPCESDAECASVDSTRPLCATSGACVQCRQNSDCGALHICRAGACAPGCATDAECAGTATPRCLPTASACVACLGDGDCTGGKVCRANACVLPGCSGDGDCAAPTPRCKLSTRACVACLSAGDCGAGQDCVNDACTTTGLDQPCNADGTCPGSFVCVQSGTGTPTCRAPCSIYAAPSTCPADRRCAFTGFAAGGAPEGACVPTRAGSGQLGAVCSATSLCDEDLECIYDTATSGRCRRYCNPASPGAACGAPSSCQRLVVLDEANVPRTVGVCFPDTTWLDPCSSDQTCGAGQVCSVSADPQAPTELRNLCDWPVGGAEGLARCRTGATCQSGVCLHSYPDDGSTDPGGYCQEACAQDSQCPTVTIPGTPSRTRPGACEDFPFSWRDATGAPVTRRVPSCAIQCDGEFDCGPDDSCGSYVNHARTKWVTRCEPGDDSGAGLLGGAPCTAHSECWSGYCWKLGATTDGFCEGACNPSRVAGNPNYDCDESTTANGQEVSQCPTGGVVLWTGPGTDGLTDTADDVWSTAKLCWPRACTKDSDCAGLSKDASKPRACSFDWDPASAGYRDIVLSCHPRIGTLRGGAPCARHSDCASDWCIEWQSGTQTDSRCFGACSTLADCATSTADPTECVNDTWVTGGKTLKLCEPIF